MASEMPFRYLVRWPSIPAGLAPEVVAMLEERDRQFEDRFAQLILSLERRVAALEP
ncbi:MAG: hypothetical protein AB7G37_03435 [Solirubrobacteraceae bacterium]